MLSMSKVRKKDTNIFSPKLCKFKKDTYYLININQKKIRASRRKKITIKKLFITSII